MQNKPLIVDDEYMRAAYTRLTNIAQQLNDMFGAGILVQPGDLLSEQNLQDGTTNYEFPVLQQEINNSTYPLSYGANQNDVFVGILGELTVDNRTPGSPLVYPQRYYNKFVFTAANTTQPSHIQAVWNAVVAYAVGSKTYIQRMFTRVFLNQPRTQQSSADNYPDYNGRNGLVRLIPYILASGKATNKLTLTFKPLAGFAPGGTGGTNNVLSWYMQGFTLQNGAGYVRFFTGELDVETYYAMFVEQNKGKSDRSQWTPLKTNEDFSAMP